MTLDRSLLLAEIPHLRRYARVLLRDPPAEDDLVQSSLERALLHLDQWRQEQPLRPWLLAIMHNLYVSGRRRQAAAPPLAPLNDDILAAVPAGQEARLEARRVLAAALGLPEEQRLAVLLVGIEELSYKDAAAILDIPIGTLMSRLHRGRERLREVLGMVPRAQPLDRVK